MDWALAIAVWVWARRKSILGLYLKRKYTHFCKALPVGSFCSFVRAESILLVSVTLEPVRVEPVRMEPIVADYYDVGG